MRWYECCLKFMYELQESRKGHDRFLSHYSLLNGAFFFSWVCTRNCQINLYVHDYFSVSHTRKELNI